MTGQQQEVLPVVVGITGASGSVLAFRLMAVLLAQHVPVELVCTEKSLQVILEETGLKWVSGHQKVEALLTHLQLDITTYAPLLRIYGNQQLDAPPASGTHLTQGMVVIPCSMGTLGKVAHGIGDNLVCRAADVHLKERRNLVLVPREAPLSAIHLDNMQRLATLGVSIVPPMLTFYLKTYHSLDAQIDFTVGKVLDQLHIQHTCVARWGAPEA